MLAYDREQLEFVFCLLPEFDIFAFSSAIEALRLANREIGFKRFAWRVVSMDGSPVPACTGLDVAVESSVESERRLLNSWRRPSLVAVLGQTSAARSSARIEAWVRECHNRGVTVAGIGSGVQVLGNAGLLGGKRCAIHWQISPAFLERHRDVKIDFGLYTVDGRLITCAGGAAVFDLMLQLVRQDQDPQIVERICELAIVDRPRLPDDRQRVPFMQKNSTPDPTVVVVLRLMEENLLEPLSLAELSAAVKLSRRQIEHLFHAKMGDTPARVYLRLRLERSHALLTQTNLPIVKVAISCGFVSASHFSKSFRLEYGYSPQECRLTRAAIYQAAQEATSVSKPKYEAANTDDNRYDTVVRRRVR